MQIYISSLAFLGNSAEEIIQTVSEKGWAIEFSSGLPYQDNMESLFLQCQAVKLAHNYFPASKVPFVLNLASKSEEIRNKSLDHCLKLLELSKKANARFFAAHAGFCIDPHPSELGNKISFYQEFDKEEHKKLFLDSLNIILRRAEQLEINFLIENNVISPFNLSESGSNPLLCCSYDELNWMMKMVGSDHLGVLLDTAHLKVSCQTLGLDRDQEIKKLIPLVAGLHHSDNNGFSDTNEVLDKSYWFLPYLKYFPDHVHVIEVKKIDNQTIQKQINLLKHGC